MSKTCHSPCGCPEEWHICGLLAVAPSWLPFSPHPSWLLSWPARDSYKQTQIYKKKKKKVKNTNMPNKIASDMWEDLNKSVTFGCSVTLSMHRGQKQCIPGPHRRWCDETGLLLPLWTWCQCTPLGLSWQCGTKSTSKQNWWNLCRRHYDDMNFWTLKSHRC